MNRENRLRRAKKRARYYAKRDERRPLTAAPAWHLPRSGTALNDLTLEELNAIAIHPMATGLGMHPRTVADEDWVESVLRIRQEVAEADFWTRFIHVLKESFGFWWNRDVKVNETPGPYPEIISKRTLPAVSVEHYSGKEWTTASSRGIVCNPIYTGIGIYPQLTSTEKWVRGIMALEHGEGVPIDQILVDILWMLKQSFGADGQPHIYTPIGYQKIDR